MPPFSLAILTSLKYFLLTYLVDIPYTTERPNEAGDRVCESLNGLISCSLHRQTVFAAVGNVFAGRVLWSVAVLAFSAPQAASYVDNP